MGETEALCRNCRFWKEFPAKSDVGECLRYPPVVPTKDVQIPWLFPRTKAKQTCGEFHRNK